MNNSRLPGSESIFVAMAMGANFVNRATRNQKGMKERDG